MSKSVLPVQAELAVRSRVPADELFSPVINTRTAEKVYDKANNMLSKDRIAETAGIAFLLVGFAGLFATFPLSLHLNGWATFGLAAATGLFGWFATHIAGFFNRRTAKNRTVTDTWNFIMQKNQNALILWLKERYGIIVKEGFLDDKRIFHVEESPTQNIGLIAANLNNYPSYRFYDTDDNKYTLRTDDSGNYYVDADEAIIRQDALGQKITVVKGATLTVKPEIVAVPEELSNEVIVLRDRINSRLSILDRFKLSVEHQHVVNRVSVDMTSTLAALEKISALGVANDSDSALTVLTKLDSELHAVLVEETADVQRELNIQAVYVDSR